MFSPAITSVTSPVSVMASHTSKRLAASPRPSAAPPIDAAMSITRLVATLVTSRRTGVLRTRARLLDGAPGVTTLAADQDGPAVDDHHWCVEARQVERLPVGALAGREARRREGVVPSETIPVVDVLAERHDHDAGHRLVAFERPENRVGGGQLEQPWEPGRRAQ